MGSLCQLQQPPERAAWSHQDLPVQLRVPRRSQRVGGPRPKQRSELELLLVSAGQDGERVSTKCPQALPETMGWFRGRRSDDSNSDTEI